MGELLIGIAAHVSRLEMAQALRDRVDADFLHVDRGHAETFDEKISACVATHLEVLQALSQRATGRQWCIVLEDDALPVDNFRFHAAEALDSGPSTGLAGFYISHSGLALNRKAILEAYGNGIRWASAHHLVSAVAYAVRAHFLPSIIDRYQAGRPTDTVERRLTEWALQRRVTSRSEPRFYYTMPSLVDHSTTQSIITPDTDGEVRRAWRVGVADDWATADVEYDP